MYNTVEKKPSAQDAFLHNLEYMENNEKQLDQIQYSPHKNVSLLDYLKLISLKKPWMFQLINLSILSPVEWDKVYKSIELSDMGGFEHGGKSVNGYTYLQKDLRYFLSRKNGYKLLINLLQADKKINSKNVIVDMLAGNGTFERVVRQLNLKDFSPSIIGMDISEAMVSDAITSGENVIRTCFTQPLLSPNIADSVMAAYGVHHIPINKRHDFVRTAYQLLKKGGRFVLQDFSEGSVTEKWYSEIIDKYRIGGHAYTHFSEESLMHLLYSQFKKISIQYIYDPFCLTSRPGQGELALKKEFFSYMIKLFSLEKLLPTDVPYNQLDIYENLEYWKMIENTLEPYFSIDKKQSELIKGGVPFCKNFSLLRQGEELMLVAPRIAIAGIAIK